MAKDRIGPFPALKRFALDELQSSDGRKAVLLLVESKSNTGDEKRIELAMHPEEAIRNGNALVAIGTALQATKH